MRQNGTFSCETIMKRKETLGFGHHAFLIEVSGFLGICFIFHEVIICGIKLKIKII